MSDRPKPCACTPIATRLTRRAALATTTGLLATACAKASRWEPSSVVADGGVIVLDLNDHPSLAPPGGYDAFKVAGVRSPILVMRIENDAFRVLSLQCPHLGCTVRWNNGTQQLECPCHGSTFDDVGRPTKGPAKRQLASYRWQMTGTRLHIAVAT